jgi:hypothetical protein
MVKLRLNVTERWDPEPVSGAVTLRIEKVYKDVLPEEIVVEVLQVGVYVCVCMYTGSVACIAWALVST